MDAEQAAGRAAQAAEDAAKAAELVEVLLGLEVGQGVKAAGAPAAEGGRAVAGVPEGFRDLGAEALAVGAGEEHRLAIALQRAFVQARIQGLGKPARVSVTPTSELTVAKLRKVET